MQKTVKKPAGSSLTPCLGYFQLIDNEQLFENYERSQKMLNNIIAKCDQEKFTNQWYSKESAGNKLKMLEIYQFTLFSASLKVNKKSEGIDKTERQIQQKKVQLKKSTAAIEQHIIQLKNVFNQYRIVRFEFVKNRYFRYQAILAEYRNPFQILQEHLLYNQEFVLFRMNSFNESQINLVDICQESEEDGQSLPSSRKSSEGKNKNVLSQFSDSKLKIREQFKQKQAKPNPEVFIREISSRTLQFNQMPAHQLSPGAVKMTESFLVQSGQKNEVKKKVERSASFDESQIVQRLEMKKGMKKQAQKGEKQEQKQKQKQANKQRGDEKRGEKNEEKTEWVKKQAEKLIGNRPKRDGNAKNKQVNRIEGVIKISGKKIEIKNHKFKNYVILPVNQQFRKNCLKNDQLPQNIEKK